MKRVVLLLLFCILFFSCKKDETYPKELDFKQLFGFVGESLYTLQKEFKGVLKKDTIYNKPHRDIFYNLVTQEKIYQITFSSYDGMSINGFAISVKESYSTKGGIVSFVKKLSDRAYSASSKTIEDDTYHAEYTTSSIKDYNDREEFWDYFSDIEIVIERLSES